MDQPFARANVKTAKRRTASRFILCLLLIGLRSSSVGAEVFLREDFDGSALNPSVWSVHPGDGVVAFENGRMQLSSPPGVFPYVVTAWNPFPPSGDFRVRLGFRYISVQNGGNGFAVITADCDGHTDNCNPGIKVWQDWCCGGFRAYAGDQLVDLPTWTDIDYHVFQWDLVGSTYTFTMDDAHFIWGTMTRRPLGLWIGHLPRSYVSWTSQETDFVEVTTSGDELPTPATSSTWGRVKATYRD